MFVRYTCSFTCCQLVVLAEPVHCVKVPVSFGLSVDAWLRAIDVVPGELKLTKFVELRLEKAVNTTTVARIIPNILSPLIFTT